MAVVRKAASIRANRDSAPGYRNTISRILAGPAQDSDVTVRLVSVKPGGRLPRRNYGFQRVVTVIQGELLFMDGDGAVHIVAEGDAVIVRLTKDTIFRTIPPVWQGYTSQNLQADK